MIILNREDQIRARKWRGERRAEKGKNIRSEKGSIESER